MRLCGSSFGWCTKTLPKVLIRVRTRLMWLRIFRGPRTRGQLTWFRNGPPRPLVKLVVMMFQLVRKKGHKSITSLQSMSLWARPVRLGARHSRNSFADEYTALTNKFVDFVIGSPREVRQVILSDFRRESVLVKPNIELWLSQLRREGLDPELSAVSPRKIHRARAYKDLTGMSPPPKGQ